MSGYNNLGEEGKKLYSSLKSKGIKVANKYSHELQIWKESPAKDNNKALQSVKYFEREIKDLEATKKAKIEAFIKKVEEDNNKYRGYLENQLESAQQKYEASKIPPKPKALKTAELSWENFLEEWNNSIPFVKCPISIELDKAIPLTQEEEKPIITKELPPAQVQKSIIQVESNKLPVDKNGMWMTQEEIELQKLRRLAQDEDRQYRREIQEQEEKRKQQEREEQERLRILEKQRIQELRQRQKEEDESNDSDSCCSDEDDMSEESEGEKIERLRNEAKKTFTQKEWDEVEEMNRKQRESAGSYSKYIQPKESPVTPETNDTEQVNILPPVSISISSKPSPQPISYQTIQPIISQSQSILPPVQSLLQTSLQKPMKQIKKVIPRDNSYVSQSIHLYSAPITNGY